MSRLPAFPIVALLLAALGGVSRAQCPGNGLTLTTTGGRLGDPFAISLSGTPGVSGLLAFDFAPGPVSSPIGPVCLGLTQSLQVQPFSLNASGGFGVAGILPANPALSGKTAFLQAAAADATQPGGFALSNGASVTLRPPRAYVVNYGVVYSSPGSWAAYDVLNGTVGSVFALPSSVRDAVAIPALGWIGLALDDGTFRAYDGTTGNLMLTIGLTAFPWTVSLAVDGTTLIAVHAVSLGFSNVLRTFQLPLGTPGVTVQVPYYGPFISVPGSNFVYFPLAAELLPVYLPTGVTVPLISPGAVGWTDWIRNGSILYGVVYAPGSSSIIGLNAVDTATNTPLFLTPVPPPFPLAITFGTLHYGPGSTGPSLFVGDSVTGAVFEFSAQTLTATSAPIVAPAPLSSFAPSTGGTEWLAVQGGLYAYPTVYSMHPVTHAFTLIGQISSLYDATVHPVPSATLTTACIKSGNTLFPISTDPATTIQHPVLLPFASANLLLVVD